MRIYFFTILICIFSLLCLLEISFARSRIRCGNNLVSVGDLKIKVLDRCGEPILKEKIELGLPSIVKEMIIIDIWNNGRMSFITDITMC
jgi:hypothetical protein